MEKIIFLAFTLLFSGPNGRRVRTATATSILVYGLANLDHLLSREGKYVEKRR